MLQLRRKDLKLCARFRINWRGSGDLVDSEDLKSCSITAIVCYKYSRPMSRDVERTFCQYELLLCHNRHGFAKRKLKTTLFTPTALHFLFDTLNTFSKYFVYLLSSKIIFPVTTLYFRLDGSQNCHIAVLTGHIGLFFHKAAYSSCDILSKML
jgi:hypothetical protein